MLNNCDGQKLIELAKQSLFHSFSKTELNLSQFDDSFFYENRGIFITLYKDGKMRGCVGYPQANKPLIETVPSVCLSAAFRDMRYPPLKESELSEITFQISVLSQPQKLLTENIDDYYSQIKIGEDGIIVKDSVRYGLLLPHVPVNSGWNVDDYLGFACSKAGLTNEAWKSGDLDVYKFNAQTFEE